MHELAESGNHEAAEGDPQSRDLTIAIVVFQPDVQELELTIRSLARALEACDRPLSWHLTLIDHSPEPIGASEEHLATLANKWFGPPARVILDRTNPGFGRGHNRTIASAGHLHLILNPDVEIDSSALKEALHFMRSRRDCGALVPSVRGEDGKRQFLCKRYPSVLDLLLRGFAPQSLRRLFSARLDRYEMRDVIGDEVVWDPPIVSGCFMLFRGDVFRQLGGFDPRFFLYFEDFDLSLRAGKITRLAYVPSVRIVHHGGHAARKGLRHIWLFAQSAYTFFSKHGWRWF